MSKFETRLTVCTVALYLIAGGTGLAPAAEPLGSGFSFQGQLKQGGAPLKNTADLEFTLHDSAALGNQIGGVVAIDNVTVVDGLFTVEVNSGGEFGPDVLNGEARFLEVAVRSPAGSGVFTTLDPRQPLTATPYALQTRGIFVDAAGNVGIGTSTPIHPLHVVSVAPRAIYARNNADTGTGYGVFGLSQSSSGTGVFGLAIHTFGSNTGVEGETNSSSGIGVHGRATATSGTNYGVYGQSDSTFGRGVYGEATASSGTNYGGFFRSTATNGRGVFGEASASIGTTRGGSFSNRSSSGIGVFGKAFATTGINYGGRFESRSTTGRGVFGLVNRTTGINYGGWFESESTTGRGIFGLASANSGVNFGVVGHSNSPDGFDFWASGAGTNYGSPSSRRWKSNVVPIGDPLSKLAKLQGVYFDWDKDHGGLHDVGMIAEEVGGVMPEIVQYEENGIDAIGMDYSKMTPLLVEAIKELHGQVQRKDSQITELQARLAALETLVERLTANRNGGAE